jgi:hypothetical protein
VDVGFLLGHEWLEQLWDVELSEEMGKELSGVLFGVSLTESLDLKLGKRGPIKGVSKADLPTPALLFDLAILDQNVAKMAEHARSHGKSLRPHAKTHKCVEIARRQQAAGAVGVCVATVPEAEVMSAGGIDGILLTSPIAMSSKAERMAALVQNGRNVFVAVDHPGHVVARQARTDELPGLGDAELQIAPIDFKAPISFDEKP